MGKMMSTRCLAMNTIDQRDSIQGGLDSVEEVEKVELEFYSFRVLWRQGVVLSAPLIPKTLKPLNPMAFLPPLLDCHQRLQAIDIGIHNPLFGVHEGGQIQTLGQ